MKTWNFIKETFKYNVVAVYILLDLFAILILITSKIRTYNIIGILMFVVFLVATLWGKD